MEYMIFSAVRCNKEGNIGFLENEKRTNVALTRAKHGLIIVGNARTLSSDKKWQKLIDELRESQIIVEGYEGAIKRIEEME